MIEINEKKTNCCGCSGCVQACPRKCIFMYEDEEGFPYPEIDPAECIGCGICDGVCPVENKESLSHKEDRYPIFAGGWHKDEEIRAASSSGGAFSLFADYVLSKNGLVYGCALDKNLKAQHICVDKPSDLNKLRGSKYVQSSLEEVYSDVKKNIKEGRMVLFTGTPCQTAGLYSFIGNERYENLYTVDFICHGVPSPHIFKTYISELEKELGTKISSFSFRSKDHGWNQSGLQLGTSYTTDDGRSFRNYPAFRDPFMNGFLDDAYLRPICYECPFKGRDIGYADFTIADFWGVNRVNPSLNDKKGTSLVLIMNRHAESLWESVKDRFEYAIVREDKALRNNRTIFASAERRKNRDCFFEDYHNKGYGYVKKKYMSGFTWAWHKICGIIKRMEQFIRFAVVGCTNTLINLAVYYTCIYLGMHYNLAYTLGFLVSVCNAFYWNNKVVFVNKQEQSLLKAFIKVLMSYGASFLLSLVLMSVLIDILHISTLLAPLIKMSVTIPINFILNKLWAFRDRVKV